MRIVQEIHKDKEHKQIDTVTYDMGDEKFCRRLSDLALMVKGEFFIAKVGDEHGQWVGDPHHDLRINAQPGDKKINKIAHGIVGNADDTVAKQLTSGLLGQKKRNEGLNKPVLKDQQNIPALRVKRLKILLF